MVTGLNDGKLVAKVVSNQEMPFEKLRSRQTEDTISNYRVDVQNGETTDPGIIESRIPIDKFEELMKTARERDYRSFYPYVMESTEIVIRDEIGIQIFDDYIVK